ncbi:MAG: DMT family transporter [Granulosicoccus sp.]
MASSINFSLCTVFVLMWSSGWIGSKFGVDLVGPFTFLTWRYVIVVTILGAILVLSRKWKPLTPGEWTRYLNIGLLSHGVYLGASLSSLNFGVSVGMVGLVTSMQPMFTAFLAQRFTGESTSKYQWMGVILGMAAVLTLVITQLALGDTVLGYVLLVSAVLGLSLATLIDRAGTLEKEQRSEEPTPLLQVLFIHSVAALAFFALFGVSLENMETTWSPALIGSLAYMAIFVSIGSYGLLFLLLRRMAAVKVSSLAYLTQGATMVMAWLLLGETLTDIQWVGVSLATTAVIIVQLDRVDFTALMLHRSFGSTKALEASRKVA